MNAKTERGSVTVEFLVAALCLILPVMALAITTHEISTAQFAVTAAARQGAREFSRSPTIATGMNRAKQVADLAFRDFGIESAKPEMFVECSAQPCLTPGSLITMTVSTEVPLRFLPSLPGIAVSPGAQVSGSMTTRVSIGGTPR